MVHVPCEGCVNRFGATEAMGAQGLELRPRLLLPVHPAVVYSDRESTFGSQLNEGGEGLVLDAKKQLLVGPTDVLRSSLERAGI